MEENLIFIKDSDTGIISIIAKYLNFKNFKTIYKKKYNYSGIVYKVIFKFKLPLRKLFFDSWKKEKNDKIKNVILLDSGYKNYIVKLLKKSYPKANIILYYWNSINDYNKKFLEDLNVDKFFTFDKRDADKYGIKYNPQFYTKNIKLRENLIKNDILFIGRAKNRKEYILNIKKKVEKAGCKSDIIIIEDEKEIITYDKYLEKLEESKTILDIVDGEQIGLTVRCMESLFLEKKLITNNKDIKNYDFYNFNNIFILGIDDIKDIKRFIESPYKPVNKEIIYKYDFSNWIKRFNV